MANNVLKVNGLAIASIAKINGETDTDIAKLNGEEFAGITEWHTFIKSESPSNVSSVSFGDGTSSVVMDSTYDIYEWHFINLHPVNDNADLMFQVNATDDAGGSYDASPIHSTFTYLGHNESGSSTGPGYDAGFDTTNDASSYTNIGVYFGNANDEAGCGVLRLYAPSNSTYVKHWNAEIHNTSFERYAFASYTGGYINDTTPIDEISFKFDTGNIESGEIRMYGIKGG